MSFWLWINSATCLLSGEDITVQFNVKSVIFMEKILYKQRNDKQWQFGLLFADTDTSLSTNQLSYPSMSSTIRTLISACYSLVLVRPAV